MNPLHQLWPQWLNLHLAASAALGQSFCKLSWSMPAAAFVSVVHYIHNAAVMRVSVGCAPILASQTALGLLGRRFNVDARSIYNCLTVLSWSG
jgi:hypothetical protein